MRPTYIYGCGGHGRVVLDLLTQHQMPVAGFIDDNLPNQVAQVHGIPILKAPVLEPDACQWIVAIGNNGSRQAIVNRLIDKGCHFVTLIHPSAQIGSRVSIGPGSVIMANTAINCDTSIGSHVIINLGSNIDHDCVIGDFCHIAPGSTLGGHVRVSPGMALDVGSRLASGTILTP